MARDRDDYTDEPPRRRRDDDYDDEPRRPARRRRDEEDDDYPDVRRKEPLTGLDGMFANTSMVALVLFGLCCGDIALILGIIGLVACKDAKARQNALIVTIISAVRVVLAVIFILANNLK